MSDTMGWYFGIERPSADQGSVALLGAVVGGQSDWEWLDRGGMQEFGGSAAQVDGCVLAIGAGKQNGATRYSTPTSENTAGKCPHEFLHTLRQG